eukprot:1977553-Prymnesium_polylepis.1
MMMLDDSRLTRRPGSPGSTRCGSFPCMLPECTLGTRTRGHEAARYGVSTVSPPPASSLQGLCGHLYERLM